MYTFDKQQLSQLVIDCARQGALEAISHLRPVEDKISLRKSYDEFGRARVERWINEGRVNTYREGSSKNSTRYLSRAELSAQMTADKMYVAHHQFMKHNQ